MVDASQIPNIGEIKTIAQRTCTFQKQIFLFGGGGGVQTRKARKTWRQIFETLKI
jgi:hypothetical protein